MSSTRGKNLLDPNPTSIDFSKFDNLRVVSFSASHGESYKIALSSVINAAYTAIGDHEEDESLISAVQDLRCLAIREAYTRIESLLNFELIMCYQTDLDYELRVFKKLHDRWLTMRITHKFSLELPTTKVPRQWFEHLAEAHLTSTKGWKMVGYKEDDVDHKSS